VDLAGNTYITGYTYSSEASFPVAVGPDLTYNGDRDAFIAKVGGGGAILDYCGYIGGTAEDRAYHVAVDASGSAYVAGYTVSTQASFPVTVGPNLTYNGGDRDVFVAKITGTCCIPPTVGDMNQSGEMTGNPNSTDLSILIDCLFISYDWTGICLDEADVDFSCGRPCEVAGTDINSTDLSAMITSLFISYLPMDGCDGP